MTAIHAPLGADITSTHTTAQFKVGTRAYGEDNTEWLYVKASAAIKQYRLVGIDEDFTATACTTTQATAGFVPGFAQVAFAASDYGWVAVKGSNIYCKGVVSACSPDTKLYVNGSAASAGLITTTSGAAGIAMLGVVCVTTASGTTTANVEIIAVNPFFMA